MRLNALIIFVLLSMAKPLLAQDDKASALYDFDVNSQGVEGALSQLASQAGCQLLFSYEVVGSQTSQQVLGRYTINAALSILLEGTYLSGRLTEHGVILVTLSEKNFNRGDKSMNTKKNLLAATVAFFSGVGGAQVGLAQEANEQKESGWVLEEIIVTAQKRGEQSLRDVPISMSVLGGDALDRISVQGVQEALAKVAGVNVTSGFSLGTSEVVVRGVAPSGSAFAGSNTVGYYLDDLPFAMVHSALVPDAGSYDLARVEVLRGPQGTLYGAGSLNGVVRILTQEVNIDELEFKARASISNTEGGGDNYRGDVAFNTPLVPGKLAVRGVLGINKVSGWIDNVDPSLNDLNGGDLENYRLKVKAHPVDDLTLGLAVWHSRSDFEGQPLASESRVGTVPFRQPGSSDFDSYNFTVAYDFDGFSVSSSTSDLDHVNKAVAVFEDFGGGFISTFNNEMFAQEFRAFSTDDGDWQWSVGVMYREATEDLDQPFVLLEDGGVNGDSFPAVYISESESSTLFGEVTKSLLDETLELTVGLRYFEDEITESEGVRFITPEPLPLYKQSEDYDKVTPRVVLTWYPSDDLTLYASYAEGFRSGFVQDVLNGPSGAPNVQEDTLTNYEVGAKGGWLEGRLVYDAALYYIDWTEVQQTATIVIDGLPFAAPTNGSDASGVGFDFGLTATPTDRLQIGLNFSWNDLTFDNDVVVNDVPVFESGDRLNNSAEYTAGLSLDYSLPLGSHGWEGQFSASLNHISSMSYVDIFTDDNRLDSDDLTSGRVSFTITSAEQHWSTGIFVDNVTDEDGSTYRNPTNVNSGINDNAVYLRPRTVGLQVEYHL